MSVVTGVMLLVGALDWDGESLSKVQSWLAERGRGQLSDCSDASGGNKHPQFEAWAAGINYFLDVDEFAAFAMSLPWRAPENTVLILHPETGPTQVLRPSI